jgi:RHS repeat-associated protein
VTSSSNAPTITQKWQYKTTDIKDSSSGWQNYYDVDKVSHSEIDDASGHVWQCQDTSYDQGSGGVSGGSTPQAGWPTTTTTYSTCGNSSTAMTSYTGYDQYGNVVATVDPLATANPSLYSGHGCTLSQAPTYLSTSWTAGRYTSCTAYDTSNTAGLPVTQTNALGQATSLSYDYTSGAQLTSTTDPNNQQTGYSYAYDNNGNETINTSQPGETGSYTTRQIENSQCADWRTLSSPQDLFPCYEIDSNTSLYPGAITRTFYDVLGRAVETRTPGPTLGDDTVVITVYNDQLHAVWTSEPFQVADGSGWIDPSSAKDINGNTPASATTFYDALGRVIATQDLNWHSSQEPGLACSTVSALIAQLTTGNSFTSCVNYSFGQAVGDSTYYSLATSIDPNGHVTQSFTDGQGNVRYTQTNSGVYSGTLLVQQQTQTQYNVLNKPTSITVIDERPQSGESPTGVTITATYDDLGRPVTVNDPDQGTFTYSYDPNGPISSAVQASGSNTRTLGYNYDLLGRMTCKQTAAPTINATGACSAGSPLLQNTYDTTVLGTQGTTDFPIGHLTQSVATTYYPDGTSATVTQQYQTDQRGRTTNEQMQLTLPSGWNVTSALPTYQLAFLYNDANQVTTTSATAGTAMYTFTQVYDPTNGVLQGTSNNGSSTANLATLAYNEYTLPAGLTLLNGATSSPSSIASEQFSYDANLRPTSLTANWLPSSGNSGQILSQGRTYDNGGNVTSVNTIFAAIPGKTASGGSETQNFCYDEQDRLVWAGNGGTQPPTGNGTCGSGTLGNTLSGAGYTAPFTYTNLGQLWQGPVNGQGSARQYLYCNSQPHELTGIYPTGTTCSTKGSATASYSASYDPWGNVVTRMYNSATATLSYDQLNRMVEYNAGSSGQEWYVYDASGNRVLKRSTSGGTTMLTSYAFGLQELSYTGSGVFSSQIDYYSLAGHLIGWTNGSSTTYDLTDALGSVLMSLSSSAIQGEQVYGPYGNQRYTQGTMGTDKGYTGQFYDSVTGLYYYNARYYDPVAGVFLSPDSMQGNLQCMNPYAYVKGNPETLGDPSGHDDTNPDPYLPYVGAWYMATEGLGPDKVAVDQTYAGLGFPHNDWQSGHWRAHLNDPNIGDGRPDIANKALNVIWEVKTGGGLDPYDPATDTGMGSQWPSGKGGSTFSKGVAQAQWYALRMSMMTGKTWSPGDSKNDPQMGAAMTLCGGVCTVEYSDGSEMEIMATNLGVIQYQFVPGKGQKPVGQPVVVAVKSRQGQRYSAPQWQKALGLAMIVAAFIAAVQESINWIRSLPLLLNPSGPGGPGNAGDGPGGVDIMGGGGEGHLGCCAD